MTLETVPVNVTVTISAFAGSDVAAQINAANKHALGRIGNSRALVAAAVGYRTNECEP